MFNNNYTDVNLRLSKIVKLSIVGWKIIGADSRLESRQYPLFKEPTPIVIFELAFRRDKFYDPQTGTVKRVSKFFALFEGKAINSLVIASEY